MMTGEEKEQILKTLTDFSSIAKTVKLSNIFLTSFADVLAVVERVGKVQENDAILLQMDVLIAMMEQVRLSRDNYVSVMRGVKIFVDEKSTQKRGYKILAKVIDKFEINTVDELAQIKNELTPLMKG